MEIRFFVQGSLKRSGGILDDGVDVKRGQIKHIPFIVDVVQRQQALRQLVQPFCLKQNDFQIFSCISGGIVPSRIAST